jgi:hypothetical protein
LTFSFFCEQTKQKIATKNAFISQRECKHKGEFYYIFSKSTKLARTSLQTVVLSSRKNINASNPKNTNRSKKINT